MITLTLRRYYIDDFLNASKKFMSGRVLDIGGKKDNKRGFFRPPLHSIESWEYLNIDLTTSPDYACSVYKMPFADNAFDTVIFCEILEHLERPEAAFLEISRILKPGGKLIMTMPFLYAIHGDPDDYQRWTEAKLKIELVNAGFKQFFITSMGGIFAVIFDLFHVVIKNTLNVNKFLPRVTYKLYHVFRFLSKYADKRFTGVNSLITTGYSVIATKF